LAKALTKARPRPDEAPVMKATLGGCCEPPFPADDEAHPTPGPMSHCCGGTTTEDFFFGGDSVERLKDPFSEIMASLGGTADGGATFAAEFASTLMAQKFTQLGQHLLQ
jgi:hypothetical protein